MHSDDGSYPEKCNLRTFINVFNDAMTTMGVPSPCANLKKWCIEAGFEDITEAKYKCPWGPFARDPKLKELGKYLLLNTESAFEACMCSHPFHFFSVSCVCFFLSHVQPHKRVFLTSSFRPVPGFWLESFVAKKWRDHA